MPVLFSYLLKLSISLAVVFLFYRLVLRKLTFYNCNRWYILVYTIASFFIPFIDINPVLNCNQLTDITIVQWIPIVNDTTEPNNTDSVFLHYWNLFIIILISGITFMLCRLLIQLISFRRMMRKAELISEKELKIYQVNESIIPFSFGSSVFINRDLHTCEELQEIIRHEFVHVKQKHSLDIIWAELLCIMNWYNPFAWLVKKAIRQNLEFIADNKVVENGIDKKEYQYLLLKVIGNNQFSIAAQFNFSSLKKRIAMMNKTKSAKRQLLRMLFLLPATAVLLLSFRNKMEKIKNEQGYQKNYQYEKLRESIIRDTVPEQTQPNEKGFYIDIKDNKGNCMVIVKDKNRKEVRRILLTEWNENAEYYENLYGEIPPPPTPPQPAQPSQLPNNDQPAQVPQPAKQPAQIPQPAKNKINITISEFRVDDNKAVVKLKDGTTEVYNLKDEAEKKEFIEKYNTPLLTENISVTSNVNLNTMITPALVTTLNSPVVPSSNLAIINANLNSTVVSVNALNTNLATTVNAAAITNLESRPVIAIVPTKASENITVTTINKTIPVDEKVLITITKNTSRKQLDDFKRQLKNKGFELEYAEIRYDKDVLMKITGTLKSKDGQGRFNEDDFEKLIIYLVTNGDRKYFKIEVIVKQ